MIPVAVTVTVRLVDDRFYDRAAVCFFAACERNIYAVRLLIENAADQEHGRAPWKRIADANAVQLLFAELGELLLERRDVDPVLGVPVHDFLCRATNRFRSPHFANHHLLHAEIAEHTNVLENACSILNARLVDDERGPDHESEAATLLNQVCRRLLDQHQITILFEVVARDRERDHCETRFDELWKNMCFRHAVLEQETVRVHVHEWEILPRCLDDIDQIFFTLLTRIRTTREDRVRCARLLCKAETDMKSIHLAFVLCTLIFNFRSGCRATDTELASGCAALAGRELNRDRLCTHLAGAVGNGSMTADVIGNELKELLYFVHE